MGKHKNTEFFLGVQVWGITGKTFFKESFQGLERTYYRIGIPEIGELIIEHMDIARLLYEVRKSGPLY